MVGIALEVRQEGLEKQRLTFVRDNHPSLGEFGVVYGIALVVDLHEFRVVRREGHLGGRSGCPQPVLAGRKCDAGIGFGSRTVGVEQIVGAAVLRIAVRGELLVGNPDVPVVFAVASEIVSVVGPREDIQREVEVILLRSRCGILHGGDAGLDALPLAVGVGQRQRLAAALVAFVGVGREGELAGLVAVEVVYPLFGRRGGEETSLYGIHDFIGQRDGSTLGRNGLRGLCSDLDFGGVGRLFRRSRVIVLAACQQRGGYCNQ